MRFSRLSPAWLAGAACLVATVTCRADTSPNPLRLLPAEAQFVLQVEQPRKLVESYAALDLFQQVQKLAAFREFYESTNYRRFLQLVAHLEKRLGMPWPEIVDQVGGGGMAVGSKFGGNNPPALLVVQSKNEATLRKFVEAALEVVEGELARQDVKERFVKHSVDGVDTYRLGNDLHAAVAGSALVISNKEAGLQAALKLHREGDKKSLAQVRTVTAGRKLLPADALASLWVNLEPAHQGAKELFTSPRNDPNVTILAGGLLDVAGRAPFLVAGMSAAKDGYNAVVRMPRGRDGMASGLQLHIPPADHAGTLPLLEPKGVLFSTSFYLDLAAIWEQRDKLFNADQAKAIANADNASAGILGGVKLSQLLTQAGSQHRFVAATPRKSGYGTSPATPIPAFAFVTAPRKAAEFGKTMDTLARAAALLGGRQAGLKLAEEKYKDINIVGYRFEERGAVTVQVNDIRLNFSPCFATVGDQWVAASTIEYCRDLIDLLQAEKSKLTTKPAAAKKGPTAAVQTRFYATGGAMYLQSIEDVLLAQTVLAQAIPQAEAQPQVKQILDLVRKLGTLTLEERFGEKDFRYDIRWRVGK